MTMKTLKSLLLICLCFSLGACSPQPQAATLPPIVVTTIHSTPSPTATSQPPTASNQLPTPTNTLVVPGTPAGLLGPDNFPDNVNPLTGEVVADPQSLNHRPLAIK